MIDFGDFSSEVFQILRTYGDEMVLYDEAGTRVFEPTEARRFYMMGDNILVSITEDGDNSSLKLFLSQSLNLSQAQGFITMLRSVSIKANLMFHVKKFNKEIKPQDFATRASVNETENMNMNIMEGLYGTSRSSYLKLENARMIVRHSAKVRENVIGSRGRNIMSIFVENAVGERQLFPVNVMSGARAMTQHVNQGGTFADAVGVQIIRMAHDFKNLANVNRYGQTVAIAQPEEFPRISEAIVSEMQRVKRSFARMYETRYYGAESKRVAESASLMEDSEELSGKVAQLTAILGEGIDEAALLSVARLITIQESAPVTEDENLEESPFNSSDSLSFDEVETMLRHSRLVDMMDSTGSDAIWQRVINRVSDLLGGEIGHILDTQLTADYLHYNQRTNPHVKEFLSNIRSVSTVVRDTLTDISESFDTPNNPVLKQFDEWMEAFDPESIANEGKTFKHGDDQDAPRKKKDHTERRKNREEKRAQDEKPVDEALRVGSKGYQQAARIASSNISRDAEEKRKARDAKIAADTAQAKARAHREGKDLAVEGVNESFQDMYNTELTVNGKTRPVTVHWEEDGNGGVRIISIEDSETFKEYIRKVSPDQIAELEQAAQEELDDDSWNESIEEDTGLETVEAWKQEIRAANPQVATALRFNGRVENGKTIISAEVPGQDRCYGVYDVEADEYDLLGEAFFKPKQQAATSNIIILRNDDTYVKAGAIRATSLAVGMTVLTSMENYNDEPDVIEVTGFANASQEGKVYDSLKELAQAIGASSLKDLDTMAEVVMTARDIVTDNELLYTWQEQGFVRGANMDIPLTFTEVKATSMVEGTINEYNDEADEEEPASVELDVNELKSQIQAATTKLKSMSPFHSEYNVYQKIKTDAEAKLKTMSRYGKPVVREEGSSFAQGDKVTYKGREGIYQRTYSSDGAQSYIEVNGMDHLVPTAELTRASVGFQKGDNVLVNGQSGVFVRFYSNDESQAYVDIDGVDSVVKVSDIQKAVAEGTGDSGIDRELLMDFGYNVEKVKDHFKNNDEVGRDVWVATRLNKSYDAINIARVGSEEEAWAAAWATYTRLNVSETSDSGEFASDDDDMEDYEVPDDYYTGGDLQESTGEEMSVRDIRYALHGMVGTTQVTVNVNGQVLQGTADEVRQQLFAIQDQDGTMGTLVSETVIPTNQQTDFEADVTTDNNGDQQYVTRMRQLAGLRR